MNSKESGRYLIKDVTLSKCEIFQREVYPKYLDLLKMHDKYKIGILDKTIFNKETGIIIKPNKFHPKGNDFLDKTMLLFNEMDAFAAYVVDKTIFDEKLAFEMQGKAFCDIIEHLKNVYEMYIYVDAKAYIALTTVYERWSKMLV